MFIQSDWNLEKLKELEAMPLFKLISKAHHTHTHFHEVGTIQVCHLISIKTGGCPEDCNYCAQSSRYQTPISAQPMLSHEVVLNQAKEAIAQGATRICLGAAWREVRENKPFEEVLKMVKSIAQLGAEVCCTLGMLNESQAKRLKEAGLYAYNHNLDSSERFYPTFVTTRTYQDRLNTLNIASKAELSLCCGAIIGMGETPIDRLEFLLVLSKQNPPPGSVPINQLTPIPGTPLEKQPKLSIWEMIRMVAITRIVFPKAMVRLSAGRIEMSYEQQALAFFAGANSIFAGEKLLTVANHSIDRDRELFQILGLKAKAQLI